jgi:catechol 2,3-dioxygenase
MIGFLECPDLNKFRHVIFYLEGWQDVGAAADIMSVYDIPIDVGPTSHGITPAARRFTSSIPSGNRNEVFAGGCALS